MKRALIFLVLVWGVTSCNTNDNNKVVEQGWVEQPLKYSLKWKVFRSGDKVRIDIVEPYKGAKEVMHYYLLKEGSKSEEPTIVVPVTNLVVTSTTHLPALEMIGSGASLTGFPSTNFISSPYFYNRVEEGKIIDLGPDNDLSVEALLELEPQMMMGYSVNGNMKKNALIEKAGIPVLLNADYLEETPLGRAEWIKLFGLLTGKEKEADSIFNRIEQNYNQIKRSVEGSSNQPTVFSGSEYKGTWFMPAGNSWAGLLIKDAGANYLWSQSEGSGSLELSFENVFEKSEKADFWVGSTMVNKVEDFKKLNMGYQHFKVFQEKSMYNSNKKTNNRGGNDYYESGFSRPDLVLSDLVNIFHPGLLKQDSLVYFQKMN